ncbi:MAG: family transposase [Bacillales bacterium]|jgi:transposase|nr:family transposase [Bacillales bacterium]
MDYNTRKLLGLTNNNTHFTQDWLSEKNYRGTTANVISGKLSYRPLCCEMCGGEINQNQIICNDTVQTTTQLPVFNYQLTFLQLNRTRFICYSCGATFVASDMFFGAIKNLDRSLPQWFRSKFNIFFKYKEGVENSLLMIYSNGRTEGLNNKIEVIKRVSFGY